jgi:hypothetical protein
MVYGISATWTSAACETGRNDFNIVRRDADGNSCRGFGIRFECTVGRVEVEWVAKGWVFGLQNLPYGASCLGTGVIWLEYAAPCAVSEMANSRAETT